MKKVVIALTALRDITFLSGCAYDYYGHYGYGYGDHPYYGYEDHPDHPDHPGSVVEP